MENVNYTTISFPMVILSDYATKNVMCYRWGVGGGARDFHPSFRGG